MTEKTAAQQNDSPRGKLALQIVAMPADTNANGDIFGGWVVSLMDMGAAIESRYHAKCRVVTVAIDGLTFLKPVYVGDTVCCYAELIQVGKTSMQFLVEVWTDSLFDTYHKKVAEGRFTFVAIDEERRPQPVHR